MMTMSITTTHPHHGPAINWRVRWRNKTWLGLFLAALVSAGYSLLPLLGITPPVPEDTLTRGIQGLLALLTALGVIMDPTTQGVGDSARALAYEEPYPAG